MATVSTTKSSFTALGKLTSLVKNKPIRILVLGQSQVGKSALVVRYLTRRFIGEYASQVEKVYETTVKDSANETNLEVMDSNGDQKDSDRHETNIRWADVFILVYSVTDRCSFDDCNREKFLINYNKRKRRIAGQSNKDSKDEPVVLLVGNKKDLSHDRMVTTEEGMVRSRDIGCKAFYEVSAREDIDEVMDVFASAIKHLRDDNKTPRLRRAVSEVNEGVRGAGTFSSLVGHSSGSPGSPLGELNIPLALDSLIDTIVNFRVRRSYQNKSPRSTTLPMLNQMTKEYDLSDQETKTSKPINCNQEIKKQGCFCEGQSSSYEDRASRESGLVPGSHGQSYDVRGTPFRPRSCTDGLLHKGKFVRRPESLRGSGLRERNMSIAMRGENTPYD